jgi:hypothetical protein
MQKRLALLWRKTFFFENKKNRMSKRTPQYKALKMSFLHQKCSFQCFILRGPF